MFKDLKIDMPAMVTLIILVLFTFVLVFLLVRDGQVTDTLSQTLVSIVMLAVGFWLGSSSDSRKKTDMMTTPAAAPPSPVEPPPAQPAMGDTHA